MTEIKVPVNRQEYRGNEQFTVHLHFTKQLDPVAFEQCREYLRNVGNFDGPRPALEIITAMDCLIKHMPSIMTTRQGVNFYPALAQGNRVEDLGNGKCARSGFSLAFKASEKIHVQVKAKTGAFYTPQPLMDMLNQVVNGGRGGGNRGGGRGGYQGNQRSQGINVGDRNFISRQTRRQVLDHVKGLMVSL